MEAMILKQISSFLYILFNEKPEFVALALLNLGTYFYYSRSTAKKLDKMWDLIRANENNITKHENRLQMQSDHFDILDKDMERAKNTSQHALSLCFKMVNYIKNKP